MIFVCGGLAAFLPLPAALAKVSGVMGRSLALRQPQGGRQSPFFTYGK